MKNISQIPSAWADTSKLLIALGDEQRQRILLAFEPDEQLNIRQIVMASTLSRTAVSHHLRVLREAGALQSVKIGKEVFFHINKSMMTDALKGVLSYIETNI